MLKSLFKAISDRALKEEFEFQIKPHPWISMPHLGLIKKIASQSSVALDPFTELLKDADAVITSTSTSGLEAFLAGKRVVSYIPENLIALDPLLDIEDDNIYRWHEGEQLNADFLKGPATAGNSRDMRQAYFSEIKKDIWLHSYRS